MCKSSPFGQNSRLTAQHLVISVTRTALDHHRHKPAAKISVEEQFERKKPCTCFACGVSSSEKFPVTLKTCGGCKVVRYRSKCGFLSSSVSSLISHNSPIRPLRRVKIVMGLSTKNSAPHALPHSILPSLPRLQRLLLRPNSLAFRHPWLASCAVPLCAAKSGICRKETLTSVIIMYVSVSVGLIPH
jgi:hypothetical protein